MNHSLELITTTHKDPSGREVTQFQPILKPDCCASGELRFAVWQSWSDEPSTHQPARTAALASARRVLAEFATV